MLKLRQPNAVQPSFVVLKNGLFSLFDFHRAAFQVSFLFRETFFFLVNRGKIIRVMTHDGTIHNSTSLKELNWSNFSFVTILWFPFNFSATGNLNQKSHFWQHSTEGILSVKSSDFR